MKILSRLLGIGKDLEDDLERAREAQDDSGRKLAAVEQARRQAEQRLEIVEARVGIATSRRR